MKKEKKKGERIRKERITGKRPPSNIILGYSSRIDLLSAARESGEFESSCTAEIPAAV